MRVAFWLSLFAASATAQPFFVEDFEDATSRLDAGGNWTEIYDVNATRQRSNVAAHSGERGLRVERVMPINMTGADTQLERVFATLNLGESWLRWWMRVDASQFGPQALMNFGDTGVPNHVALAHDPMGLFITGYDGTGTFFADRASDRPNAAWHLYELGVFGRATDDGGVRLIVDGQDTFSRLVSFNFPNPGRHQVNVGMTYGSPQTFAGMVDYDDVRASLTQPVGRLIVTPVNGPWRAGQCIALRIGFATSDGMFSRTAEVERDVLVTTIPSLPVSESSTCATDGGALELGFDETDPSDLVYVRVPMPGTISVSATDPDLLPGFAMVTVIEAFDAGVADAGIPDGGALDAGTLDAGTLDAGALDAGALDAGTLDAGTPGVDAGVPDAGLTPLELAVGCGCQHVSVDALWALSLLVVALRRRAFRR
ncbi:MAG: hypothetical protein Q8L14_23635 [Myxococcales bacterium]|nr:hypothetical protein [Myxococcales bacterium]